MEKAITYFPSPIGIVQLRGSTLGLERLSFVEEIGSDVLNEHLLAEHVTQLQEYFTGNRKEFKLKVMPLGTHFQLNVWEELVKIPFAVTWSYERLARSLGDIKCIRAAATANGRNPLPIIIPCHRVVGKDGELTGYSAGLWRKKWLLEHEQKNIQPKIEF